MKFFEHQDRLPKNSLTEGVVYYVTSLKAKIIKLIKMYFKFSHNFLIMNTYFGENQY